MGDHAVKASGPAELNMLHRSGVKSSRPAVGIGWVTTRSRPRIATRLGIEGSGRRFAPHRPVRLLLAGYWVVLGVRESRRRLAPHRPVWGLLAGYCPWDVSPPDGGGLVPGADPALVLPVGGLASDGGGLVPGADPGLVLPVGGLAS
jgi:hypothetical protein